MQRNQFILHTIIYVHFTQFYDFTLQQPKTWDPSSINYWHGT
jgi:hypothetical protein